MLDMFASLGKPLFIFAAIFGGFWIVKTVIRNLGPGIKTWDHRPWK
ncbi:hypothetical protein [Paenibacillus mesophilus]|nr:hypothetical protein [Paenibacillus mesophilus]